MISQADIIKTLVNKNCSDEAVMSTALSKGCTLPKLLEKLTEAERFDIALDLSMKHGLGVVMLWKTWALRCLRNRNFQAAREKFRHCFLRVRQPGNRINPAQSNLLEEILNELIRLEESKLSLAEEIELIKGRASREKTVKNTNVETYTHTKQTLLCKPKIYAECRYYLKEYGTVRDHIKFYTRNFLWKETVEILIEHSNKDQPNLDKFFLTEVMQYSTSVGKFGDLTKAFLTVDPNVSSSSRYFRLIYDFCLQNRRYNLLYYVQTSIGDYVGAATTQIDFFFLLKPYSNYIELNKRLINLCQARKNYEDYIEKLEQCKTPTKATKTTPKTVINQSNRQHSLFSSMDKKEVKRRIKLIDLQIDITKNFALNEVSGCINGIELCSTNEDNKLNDKTYKSNKRLEKDTSPVTLFDRREDRKTFLSALVLIYFDLSCSTYFSKNGLDLANKLIEDQGLDRLKVYKTAMRIIIEDESCDLIESARLLLERIKEDFKLRSSSIKWQQLSQLNKAKVSGDNNKSSLSAQGSSASSVCGSGNSANLSMIDKNSDKPSVEKANDASSPPNNNDKVLLNHRLSSFKSLSKSALDYNDARSICDEVIRDSIKLCKEPDYKMELARLLSGEAKIKLYIENGKLSNAQQLAFSMNRADYVSSIIEEAVKLNQDHVKTVCQLWLAKHETRNSTR